MPLLKTRMLRKSIHAPLHMNLFAISRAPLTCGPQTCTPLHMKLFFKNRQFPDYDTLMAEVESWIQVQPEDSTRMASILRNTMADVRGFR